MSELLKPQLPVLLLVLVVCSDAALAQRRDAPARRVPPGVEAHRDLPYAETDHPRQRLDLYLPEEAAGDEPLPVIAYIHGGGWRSGDKARGVRWVLPFVRSGEYAGVSIGYRLIDDDLWPAQIHDCKAAVRWLRAHAAEYNLDPDRIGLIGTSAGGHLVSLLGLGGGVEALEGDLGAHGAESSRVSCVVDFYGPAQLRAESRLFGGPRDEREAAARDASPLTHVSEDDPPFLIVHGTEDRLVPVDQSERLHAALQEAGCESHLIIVEGGGHGRFNSDELDRRVRLFFDRCLLGRDVEIPTDPLEPGQPDEHR